MSDAYFTLNDFMNHFVLLRPDAPCTKLPVARASVLVPIVNRPCPSLLLTRRATSLRHHPGQVAFPGGMVEANDSSLIATALREAWEEVAISPASVRVVGVLPAVSSSSGFQVTPVVGIISPSLSWQANENEVASIFEMPLQDALQLGRYMPLDIQRRGASHRVWLSWFEDYCIWGMTAGIIRQLILQVTNQPVTG